MKNQGQFRGGSHSLKRGGWVVLGIAVALMLACAQPEKAPLDLGSQSDLRFLEGLMVTDAAVTVAPDHYWGPHPDGGRWSFRNSASLLVMVHRTLEEPLSLRFTPDRETRRFYFMASWDDEPLLGAPVRPAADGSVLVIGPQRLAPGLHTLTIKRAKHMDAHRDRQNHDNGFRKLAWGLGGRLQSLRLKDRDRLALVAEYLSRGVTGGSTTQMAGCLFEGGQRLVSELVSEQAGSLSFVLENDSSISASFTLELAAEVHTRVVKPEQRVPLRVPIAAGRHRLALQVKGEDTGLYLWGAPYLRPSGLDLPGPVVLVSLDTTRRDVLSPYGGSESATPNIRAFADHATVYDAAQASSPWTLPSHSSIFTGLYPSRHGAGVTDDHLAGRHLTVAELLRRRGYLTAGFAGGELCSSRWGLAQGFSTYRNPDASETRGDRLTDQVLAFLERHHADPFFLFVNYFDPHALYEAPAEFQNAFGVPELRTRLRALAIWKDFAKGDVSAWRRIISGEAEVVAPVLEFLRAAYLAEVAFMDQEIGRLLAALQEYGLYDDALIVLVSDHGELLGEGGFFSHCCRLDPELIEVPLLIKFPDQREPRRVAELVSHVDLYPTLLATDDLPDHDGLRLGLESSDHLRARGLVLMEEHLSRIHPLFENMKIANHLFGIQRPTTREIVWDGGVECSALAGDRWRDSPCAEGWRERLTQLEALLRLPEDRDPDRDHGELSEDERRRLEALGYLR